MCKTVCIRNAFLFTGKLMVLLQTIRHQDPFKILIVFLRVVAVPRLLILIHNDLWTGAQFAGEMYSHVM